jgi:hypothetical protein
VAYLWSSKNTNILSCILCSALKEGYDSDSQLIFKKREEREAIISPVEQKIAYKSIQSGGEVPLHGLRKSAPDKTKGKTPFQSFFAFYGYVDGSFYWAFGHVFGGGS